MSQQKLLIKVVGELQRLQIPYMLTGSFVSSLQGEPRSTHDIDFVVSMQKPQASALADAFQMPEYYLDKQSALEAVDHQIMFGLIELESGDKVDFWILTNDEFDQSRFQRRRTENLYGQSVHVSAPEDTILMKLKWAMMSGGSERQFGDCLRIYEVLHGTLDEGYLQAWSIKLGVAELLQRLKNEAINSISTSGTPSK